MKIADMGVECIGGNKTFHLHWLKIMKNLEILTNKSCASLNTVWDTAKAFTLEEANYVP